MDWMMNGAIRFVIALLLAAAAGAFSPARGAEPFFPAGVWYGGGKVRAPMVSRDPAAEIDQWRSDLETIRELGFNHVKCWTEWSTAEPERGVYRFEALEQMLRLCGETGLRAIIQIYTDSAPEWVGEAYPDAKFETASGRRIESQAAPGHSLDHPGVRDAVRQFIVKAAETAARHPAAHAWDVWSEPHIVNWIWLNEEAEFGFNAHTLERFRGWLSDKYGSLGALNRAWHRTFTRWDQVSPPRFGTILSYTDLIDWKAFIAWKLQSDLAMKADAVRSVNPDWPVGSHSDISSVLRNPLSGYGNPDDWLMAERVDAYGVSLYPKHASAKTPWDRIKMMMSLDGIRSAAAGRGWWIGEMQCGQGVTGVKVGEWVTPEDVRLWGWSAVSRGARSISYYAWYPMGTGYEANGYGMIELDGTVTARAREAGRFAAALDRNAAAMNELKPRPARVAILYNPLSYLAGGNTFAPGWAVRDSMMGVYRALHENNIPADFLHADEAAERASDYDLIYLPYPLLLPRATAEALEDYVGGGGALVGEARLAWNDETGAAGGRVPGLGLDKVFGCRESALHAVETAEMVAEERLPGEMAPLSDFIFQGAEYEQHLTVYSEPARVWARFAGGEPAIVASRYGRGKTIYIGSLLGLLYERNRSAATGRFLQRIALWAGVEPDIRIRASGGEIEARLLESPSHLMLIGINHSAQWQNAVFEAGGPLEFTRCVDAETGKAFDWDMGALGPVFSHSFPPRGALALLMEK